MKCKVCKAKITEEEEGISEIGYSGLCLKCHLKFKIYHTLMRVPHDATD